ncbi:MAG: DUF501 domain-containing protein [Halioglobus sp.]
MAFDTDNPEIDSQTFSRVEALLGRAPRGLRAVPVSQPSGEPMVIRVASLVDEKPFPTLYWLIDPSLCYRIDQVEASGQIKRFQQEIDAQEELQASMRGDHLVHIQQRADFMSKEQRQQIERLGYAEVFKQKGIGGISDFTRIRCLHTWYAAHLVEPNTVGGMLDGWWAQEQQP